MNHLKTRLMEKEGEDEDARKRLRIERLRKTQAGFNQTDETWAQQKTLS